MVMLKKLGFVLAASATLITAGTATAAAQATTRSASHTAFGQSTFAPEPDYRQCPKPNHLYGKRDDLRFFYFCDRQQVPHLRACPAPLVFHERIQVCDWPANVPEARNQDDANSPTLDLGLKL